MTVLLPPVKHTNHLHTLGDQLKFVKCVGYIAHIVWAIVAYKKSVLPVIGLSWLSRRL